MSFSNNLRIELIATGSQAGTWGNTTNTNLGTIIEDSIAGYRTVSITSATQALTALNGAADEARNAVIRLTSSFANNFTVFAPPVSKLYTIANDTAFTATIRNATVANGTTPTGGAAITISAGQVASVVSDANSFYPQNTEFVGTPSAPTAAFGTNTTQIATTAFVQAALQLLYPIGSIYTNAINGSNPGGAGLLNFGTWVAFGAGRVAVGFDAGNPLFDTAQETGGSADSVVVTHNHTLASTTHQHAGTTAAVGDHTHFFGPSGSFASSNNPDPPLDRIVGDSGNGAAPTAFLQGINYLQGAGGHDHAFTTGNNTVAPTVNNAGVTGVNANYQPYITVYMWRRTA
jgi:hypothetical protein